MTITMIKFNDVCFHEASQSTCEARADLKARGAQGKALRMISDRDGGTTWKGVAKNMVRGIKHCEGFSKGLTL